MVDNLNKGTNNRMESTDEISAGSEIEATVAERNPISELIFLGIVGITVLLAFITALGYHPVSGRAPLVVMTPLIILILIQGIRLVKSSNSKLINDFYVGLFKGKNQDYKKIMSFVLWMIIFCVLIYIAGHYAGAAIFMFTLMYFIGKERLKLSIIVTICVTALLFLLFEEVFNIELYRGMIFRYFMGYNIF